jgi:hypothetical protein
MHLGILSGLMVVLTGSFWGGASAHTTGAAYQTNIHTTAALYSILAQTAATSTVATGTTPTAPVPSTLHPATTITAASTVTGTGSLTATATTTNTIPPSTPIPLPTTAPQSNLQINPFDWNYLTSTPTDPKLGPFAIAFFVLMLALIGASIYFLRFKRPQWKGTNPVLFKAVNRFAPYALWVGVLGIILLIFRLIPLDPFNLRYWLYLDFLALLGLAGWMLYWYRTGYPKEMAKFLKTQKARQYMPGGSGKIASRSTPIGTTLAKGSQPPKAGGAGRPATTPGAKPAQQSSKNRKRK